MLQYISASLFFNHIPFMQAGAHKQEKVLLASCSNNHCASWLIRGYISTITVHLG